MAEEEVCQEEKKLLFAGGSARQEMAEDPLSQGGVSTGPAWQTDTPRGLAGTRLSLPSSSQALMPAPMPSGIFGPRRREDSLTAIQNEVEPPFHPPGEDGARFCGQVIFLLSLHTQSKRVDKYLLSVSEWGKGSRNKTTATQQGWRGVGGAGETASWELSGHLRELRQVGEPGSAGLCS